MMQSTNKFNTSVLIFMICMGLIGSFAIRIWLAANDPIMEHDDAISLLEATAHMSEMAVILADKTSPYFEAVPASEWQRLIQAEDKFAFQQIAYDISNIDRHAPLYFWILHVWTLVWGGSVFSGTVLNIILDLLAVLGVYRFGRNFFERPYAALVAVIWLLMPISIYVMTNIRPYSLFALLVVLFADLAYRIFFKPDPYQFSIWHAAGFILTTVLLALTHFYMMYTIFAAVFMVAIRWIRKDWKRLLFMGIQLFISLILILIIHPDYIKPFLHEGTTFYVDMPLALERVLIFTLSFIIDAPFHRGRFILLRPILISVIVGAPLLLFMIQRLRGIKSPFHPINAWDGSYVLMFFLINYLGVVGMYLGAITPLNYRYFAHVAILVALLPVLFLQIDVFQRIRSILAIAMVGFMMISAVLTTREITSFYWDIGQEDRFPNGSELVIVNMGSDYHKHNETTYRGHALQVVYNLKPENVVIISYLEALLEQPAQWLSNFCEYDTVLLLGNPHEEVFGLIEEQGFVLDPFPSYMYYTDTRKIDTRSQCDAS